MLWQNELNQAELSCAGLFLNFYTLPLPQEDNVKQSKSYIMRAGMYKGASSWEFQHDSLFWCNMGMIKLALKRQNCFVL